LHLYRWTPLTFPNLIFSSLLHFAHFIIYIFEAKLQNSICLTIPQIYIWHFTREREFDFGYGSNKLEVREH